MKSFKEQAIDFVLEDIIQSGQTLYDNPYRVGSQMYYEVFKEARQRLLEGKLRLSEINREILESDIGEYDIYENELVPLDSPMMNISEEDEPELDKPKSGGPKKYYVYVRDPKTKNIKKVTFGDTTGLKVKFSDTKARASFVARHNCDTANDKTSASYWSCRLPRFAKQLGLSDGGNFFW
jgi:hypothetical protein